MKLFKHIFIFFCITGTVRSQEVFPSNTFIQTCYNNEMCFANQNSSYLIYNEASSEFYLTIDFVKFRTGVDTIDAWLNDLDDTKFVFKGSLGSDKLPALSNHGAKTIHVSGIANFNNIANPYALDIVFFKISQDGMLFRNSGNDYYDKVRVNIQLSFKPKEFKLDRKPHHLKKVISINIGSGHINLFKPGLEEYIEQ